MIRYKVLPLSLCFLVPPLSTALASESPQDVTEYTQRIAKCEEFAKALAKPSVSERESERLLSDSEELNCNQLPTEENRLQNKYKDDPEILKTIDSIGKAESPDFAAPARPLDTTPTSKPISKPPLTQATSEGQKPPSPPSATILPPSPEWQKWLQELRQRLSNADLKKCEQVQNEEKFKAAPASVARDAEFIIEDCAHRALVKESDAYEIELKKRAPALVATAKRAQTAFLKNARKFCHPWAQLAQKCKSKMSHNPSLLECRLRSFTYRIQHLQQLRKNELQLSVNRALPDPKTGEAFQPYSKALCEFSADHWLAKKKPETCIEALTGDIGKFLRGLNQAPLDCPNSATDSSKN